MPKWDPIAFDVAFSVSMTHLLSHTRDNENQQIVHERLKYRSILSGSLLVSHLSPVAVFHCFLKSLALCKVPFFLS